ncbi:DUF1254 domain-containing protein [Sphingopyxis sp. GW247-27LB]|uniref:DUF1254 domain-containing protein n=1 Tax=Sphingopyxis sp. GW247-27LB TaxID=2012632 RepID=UPI000BA60B9A|nr:DUF1254 domain-containing protein [Sphingopyxis sp. GW247-27LB]PAL25045.1 hypothetical protein CD928_00545 [Sphingopyxis sp. GW247-27LB]
MKMLLALAAMAAAVLSGPARAAPQATPQETTTTEEDAYAIGLEAYTYAYPMVLMDVTRRVSTNAREGRLRAPVNQFAHMKTYPDASFKDVVRPNADTLYSTLWFDVGREPLILTLPDTAGRYHVVPIMDMWTEVFATLGTRTTGNDGGTVALVGPHWQGTLPAGMRMVRSPTEQGWIIGRIQTNGAADYDHVHQLQAGYAATPLSGWGKPQAAAEAKADPSVDMKTPPVEQVAQMAPGAFFALFAETLKRNPPHASDYAMLLRMERVGLVPGKSFDLAAADPAVQRGLTRAAADAYARILNRRKGLSLTKNGWVAMGNALGVYGNDYLQRAFIGYAGLGALPPEEAIYPMVPLDGEGQPLSGAARYVLHFDKDQIPPADAFWSLTMYGADQFFVANPIDRFAIGDRDKLAFNPDGSLDLYIQKDNPGADKEANWLPAPAGPFTMNLRLYLPRREALEGRWTPPPLKRLP